MECTKPKNLASCSCTYEPCSRKGNCCACIAITTAAVNFPLRLLSGGRKTYDRSKDFFARRVMKQ